MLVKSNPFNPFQKKPIKTKEMCKKYGEDDLPQGLPHEQKTTPIGFIFTTILT
jgi:hypothetical protein